MTSINKIFIITTFIFLSAFMFVRDSKAVGNQNQVNTQNQGEDQQLQVETREQEGTESGRGEGSETRNQNAIQNMSTVAQTVQEMLQLKTTGGIGDQVRQIARDQNQAQAGIQEQVNKIESKSGVAKFFFGPDYNAIGETRKMLEQNRLRIQQLLQLRTQLTNTGDQTLIQAAIQALELQNTSLQNKLDTENNTFSLFGWLVKLLTK